MEPGAAQSQDQQAAGAPSDGELVVQCLSGDRSAFDKLVRRYQKAAFGVAYRLLGERHDAEDVTQQAFIKAWCSLKTLQSPQAFGGWLMRIVGNLSLNARRSRGRRSDTASLDRITGDDHDGERAGFEVAGRDADPANGPIRRELEEKLNAAIENLPERHRLALVMFSMQGLPQKVVAEALGTTEATVKWLVFEARQQLRKALAGNL